MVRSVKFKSRGGHLLFGIVHTPEQEYEQTSRKGVILVHSGSDGRIGHGRQYVYYARRLCEEGYHVLRFDPHGMGDSEGLVQTQSWPSYWSMIQTGLYVDDLLSSVDFFSQYERFEDIALIGLCAGAVNALLVAGEDYRIKQIILLGMPVIVSDPAVDYRGIVPASSYRRLLKAYIRKAFSYEGFRRLLKSEIRFGRITELARICLKKGLISRNRGYGNAMPKISGNLRTDFNGYILSAFQDFADRGKRVLFVYGENDVNWKDFQNDFQGAYLSQNGKYHDIYKVCVIEGANHSLDQRKWQDIVINESVNWLKI